MLDDIGGVHFTPLGSHENREQRIIARDARADESSALIAAQKLTPNEMAAHQAYYNRTLGHAARLRGEGNLGGLAARLHGVFGGPGPSHDA